MGSLRSWEGRYIEFVDRCLRVRDRDSYPYKTAGKITLISRLLGKRKTKYSGVFWFVMLFNIVVRYQTLRGVSCHNTTRRHNSEDFDLKHHRRESFKTCNCSK